MTVYFYQAGGIVMSVDCGWGARAITRPKRIPKPVRSMLAQNASRQIEYNAKSREAKLVPFWEQVHGW